jgi:hypothetical protein
VRIETMTLEQKRAYVLADNKLAMNAGWDEELLAEELKGLLEIDLDFDIGVTGFSIPEIDTLIDGLAPEEPGNPAEHGVRPVLVMHDFRPARLPPVDGTHNAHQIAPRVKQAPLKCKAARIVKTLRFARGGTNWSDHRPP